MDMVERCAKAAYEAWIAPVRDLETEWDDLPRSHIERLMDAQRAAIAAMSEPTPEMADAFCKAWRNPAFHGTDTEAYSLAFAAMIDAALTSSEK